MGFLDQVLSGLTTSGSPMQNALIGLLGNTGQPGATGQAAGMGQVPGMSGGLGGLLASFEQAGLGHIAQSWVSNGPNQPVSPQQLQSVLGDDQVQTMAGQAGMAPQSFLEQLSQHLPKAVDAMTPNGQVPDQAATSV